MVFDAQNSYWRSGAQGYLLQYTLQGASVPIQEYRGALCMPLLAADTVPLHRAAHAREQFVGGEHHEQRGSVPQSRPRAPAVDTA
jgi:hypothetical protein